MNNFYTANIEMYKYVHKEYDNSDQYAEQLLREAKINKNSIQPERNDFLLVTTLLWEPHLLNDFDLYKNMANLKNILKFLLNHEMKQKKVIFYTFLFSV